jgi:glycosyltransferase involved in cell wall biosynthesis
MKLSIVIPNYNHQPFLAECLNSVKDQSVAPHELIVVDDGSTDESVEWLREHQAEYGYRLLTNDKNEGIAVSKNRGIAETTGDYILCLDSDNYLAEDFIEKISKQEADLIWSHYVKFEAENRLVTMYADNLKARMLRYAACPCFTVFRRGLWEKLGGFNPQFKVGEDWEFFTRLVFADAIPALVPEYLYYYREHNIPENSISHRERDKFAEVTRYIQETYKL